jgi:hypothetical protein
MPSASSLLTPKCAVAAWHGVASAKFASADLSPPSDTVPDTVSLCDGCVDDFGLVGIPHVVICHPA